MNKKIFKHYTLKISLKMKDDISTAPLHKAKSIMFPNVLTICKKNDHRYLMYTADMCIHNEDILEIKREIIRKAKELASNRYISTLRFSEMQVGICPLSTRPFDPIYDDRELFTYNVDFENEHGYIGSLYLKMHRGLRSCSDGKINNLIDKFNERVSHETDFVCLCESWGNQNIINHM